MSDHIYVLVELEKILCGQCPMTYCYLQPRKLLISLHAYFSVCYSFFF